VIVDEAHKFLQAARSMYGVELTNVEIPKLATGINGYTTGKSNKGANVHRIVKKLSGQSERLFAHLGAQISEELLASQGLSNDEIDEMERLPVAINPEALRHLKNILALASEVAEATADSHVQANKKKSRSKALWQLDRLGERVMGLRKHNQNIYWLENRQEGEVKSQALCAIPKNLDERLHKDLWSAGIPIILTSGTLSASGVIGESAITAGFTRAKQTLGL